MRRFGAYEIASQRQEAESKCLLGHPTYLASKDKGETSMVGKQESRKIGNVVVPASPVRMVKPGLVEP